LVILFVPVDVFTVPKADEFRKAEQVLNASNSIKCDEGDAVPVGSIVTLFNIVQLSKAVDPIDIIVFVVLSLTKLILFLLFFKYSYINF
jgi:hypothetical protein